MFDIEQFKSALETEVNDNILSFWLGLQDQELGGFYCYVDFEGHLDKSHPKAVLLHSRILWAFSAAYRVLKRPEYAAAAQHAYAFLSGPAMDAQAGGVYWMLDHAGTVMDSQKHIYNQGFAIYAFSEYYRATGDKTALAHAIQLFELIEQHAYDAEQGGYFEAYDCQWQPIDNALICDTAEGVLTEKSMNTHLHILEAYANLLRVWPDAKLKARVVALLALFRDRIIGQNGHFGLFFTRDWTCVSRDISYGHDIEGSWLIDDAARLLPEKDLVQEITTLTSRMAGITLQEGLDSDGAIFNELRDRHLLDTDRVWWVQAEGMVGFFNAYLKTLNPHFHQAAMNCWRIINQQLIDKTGGEWYWKTYRDGRPYVDRAKVEPWKCPYHNGRACLELIERISGFEESHYASC